MEAATPGPVGPKGWFSLCTAAETVAATDELSAAPESSAAFCVSPRDALDSAAILGVWPEFTEAVRCTALRHLTLRVKARLVDNMLIALVAILPSTLLSFDLAGRVSDAA